jgi:hypothetical protein
VIRPAVATYQGGALTTGVRALARGGKLAEAESLANRTVERYPDSAPARAARFEVWWRRGNHAAVAAELREHEWLGTDASVAKSFASVFAKADERLTGSAVAALVQANAPGVSIFQIGRQLHRAGHDDLAFAFTSRSTDPNPMAVITAAIQSHQLLSAWKGTDVANEWLREHLQVPLSDPLAASLVLLENEELLWRWTPDDANEEGHWTWLGRALLAVKGGLADNAHKQELLDHFAKPNPSPYYVMGRYMVGLEPESAMLALATSIHRKCEVAFYLGARARAEGRITDAVDWFRVAFETAQTRDGEYFWALTALTELVDDSRGVTLPPSPAASP